jgi:hypothetical protein
MPMHLLTASRISQAAWITILAVVAGCSRSDGQVSVPRGTPTNLVESASQPNVTSAVTESREHNTPEPTNAPPESASTQPHPQPEAPVVENQGNTAATDVAASKTETPPTPATAERQFKVEGPEDALRVSFDDFDLLKILNLDPVPPDAPERLPKWLKELDGKRIRVRGFMYPPFQDTDIRGFVLARDNQICCFGRTPKEYDLVDVFLRKGKTTHYIQNRPFDVVGVFRIKSEIEKYTAMYELEDAVVIEK